MFVSMTAYAQNKSSAVKSKSSKQIQKTLAVKPDTFKEKQAFSWQIVTDKKILAANTVFKEIIQFEYNLVTIEQNFKDEPFDFNSTIKPDKNGELTNPTYISKTLIYKFEVKNDVLILTETDTKVVKKFKIFFNKNKEAIRLQNLTNKRLYNPTPYRGASKSM